MSTYEAKLKRLLDVQMRDEVNQIIADADLLPLVDCSLTILDAPLMSVLVERWHNETFSFHLQFGEMEITMVDVSRLFHPPLQITFSSLLSLTRSLHVLWLNIT